MTIADINTLSRYLTNTTITDLTAADLLILINQAYKRVVSWILQADGRWQFDDSNWVNINEITYTLTEAQPSYTFADAFLVLEQVLVKSANGVWVVVEPVDRTDFRGIPIEEAYGTNNPTGFPLVYDKMGEDTIKLYPAPTSTYVTLASGLKIKVKRTADIFTSAQVTTGTKEPGFASPWHDILAYMSAQVYCSLYKPDRVLYLESEINKRKTEIFEHYAKRDKDDRPIITMAPINPL